MPFKSKAQQRYMFAAESRGEVPRGTAKRWAEKTKSIKKLPERVRKPEMEKNAFLSGFSKEAGSLKGDFPFISKEDRGLPSYRRFPHPAILMAAPLISAAGLVRDRHPISKFLLKYVTPATVGSIGAIGAHSLLSGRADRMAREQKEKYLQSLRDKSMQKNAESIFYKIKADYPYASRETRYLPSEMREKHPYISAGKISAVPLGAYLSRKYIERAIPEGTELASKLQPKYTKYLNKLMLPAAVLPMAYATYGLLTGKYDREEKKKRDDFLSAIRKSLREDRR